MRTIGPEQGRGRVEAIDAIRGFALMGLFFVHMVEYFELYWYAPEPGWVYDLVFGVFAGKAFALFALLFGVSFYVLLEAPGSKVSLSRGRYLWRMILLLLIGYLHSLIYAGDILQILALGGLAMLVLHRLTSKVLVILAAIFLLQVPFFFQYWLLLPDETYTQPEFWGAFSENFSVFANADLLALVQYNMWSGQLPKWIMFYETGSIWSFLGLFCVGIVLARNEFFGTRFGNRTYLLVALVLAIVALTMVVLSSYLTADIEPLMHRWVLEQGLGRIANFSIAGVYLVLGVLLFRFAAGRFMLKPFVACGRVSLSLYIMQSLVFVPIFYGFGLKWHDSIGQPAALALGILAWAVQMLLANFWLKHFRNGPFEALWRSLTQLRPTRQRPLGSGGLT